MRSTLAKVCTRCGREFVWRAKWARNWESVKYCGERCRRRRLGKTDRALEYAIVELLSTRGTKTICPSEAARRVSPARWRNLMEPAREAARRLVAADRVEIVQRGRVVDPSRARGPIRIRFAARGRA